MSQVLYCKHCSTDPDASEEPCFTCKDKEYLFVNKPKRVISLDDEEREEM